MQMGRSESSWEGPSRKSWKTEKKTRTAKGKVPDGRPGLSEGQVQLKGVLCEELSPVF